MKHIGVIGVIIVIIGIFGAAASVCYAGFKVHQILGCLVLSIELMVLGAALYNVSKKL